MSLELKDGDVVRFDYNLWIEGETAPVDTSSPEFAKESGIFDEKRTYRPLTVTLGRGGIIAGLESHIRDNGAVDESKTVSLAPEDAYGPRDVSLIQNVPMAQFKKQKVQPEVGLVINLGGKRGVVTRVSGGRVRLDMNHDLAGKALRYEYVLREVVQDDEGKLNAVLASFFPMGVDSLEITEEMITIGLPVQVNFDENWFMGKFRVLQELRQLAGERAVRFLETYPHRPEAPPMPADLDAEE